MWCSEKGLRVPKFRTLRKIHFLDKVIVTDNGKCFILCHSEVKRNDGFYADYIECTPDNGKIKVKFSVVCHF